jgi:copper chaperone CopZ
MKRLILFAAGVLLAGATLGVAIRGESSPDANAEVQLEGIATERVLLRVEGLSCGSCEQRVRDALTRRTGVKTVGVDVGGGTVAVDYARGAVDPKVLADTVTQLGYPARYLASGPAVPLPADSGAKPAGGCAGGCCSDAPPQSKEL